MLIIIMFGSYFKIFRLSSPQFCKLTHFC